MLEEQRSRLEFNASLSSFMKWIDDHMETIRADISIDKNDVEVQLKKHRNLQNEINAHTKYYDHLVKTGTELVKTKKIEALRDPVEKLKKTWKDLLIAANNKMLKLDHADAYQSFRVKLNQVNYQFSKIKNALSVEIDDSSLASLHLCAKEQKKTKKDISFVTLKVEELCATGKVMIGYQHSASHDIEQQLKIVQEELINLKVINQTI